MIIMVNYIPPFNFHFLIFISIPPNFRVPTFWVPLNLSILAFWVPPNLRMPTFWYHPNLSFWHFGCLPDLRSIYLKRMYEVERLISTGLRNIQP